MIIFPSLFSNKFYLIILSIRQFGMGLTSSFRLSLWKRQYVSKGVGLCWYLNFSNLPNFIMSLFTIPRTRDWRNFEGTSFREKVSKSHLVKWLSICKGERRIRCSFTLFVDWFIYFLGKWCWHYLGNGEYFGRRWDRGKYEKAGGSHVRWKILMRSVYAKL